VPHGSLTNYDQRHHRFRKKLANVLFIKNFIRQANSIFVATEIESLELSKSFKTREISIVGLGFPKLIDHKIVERKKLSDPISILFMGRITEKKRLDLTIRAIAELKSRHFRVQLIVAGDGPNEMIEKFQRLALELGISELVQFLGWVTGAKKESAILSADYFVLNSEDENFAVIVPEVQSFGVPVLVTDKVAFSKFVSQYESGVVIHSLEISSIVEGFEKLFQIDLERLRKNAIKCAQGSEWKEVIPKWIRGITQILEDSK
jgi:glycosyltransferase involved in cell wall biosynthesis